MNETSYDYGRPYRPWGVRAFNAVSRIGGGGAALHRERLMNAARKRTGLGDFGDESFVPALDQLLRSINEEAALTPFGRFVQKERIVSGLANRLRAEALIARHPEILAAELLPPLVIAGLQRTGTTMLHRLLSADPQARSLASWEALNPVPLPGDGDAQRKRRAKARQAERALAYIAPEFFAIHPVEAEAPEEDVLLLDLHFMSQAPEATMHVPGYAAWLEEQDHTPAYAYLRRMLLVLQWQRGGGHWVLKTPHHMEFLDRLCDVFPEAKVIQTHRDPRKTMASFCSMVAHGRGVFSDRVDAHAVARHWVRKVERMMRRSIAARRAIGEERFLDVAYAELITDPEGQLERIYAFAELDYSENVRAAVAGARRSNRPNKYGRHVYRLEDFGLDDATIDSVFGFYREHYAVVAEGEGAA